MGAKRPLQVEDFPKLSFKQPKQLDQNKMPIFTTENFPSHSTTPTVDSQAEANSNMHFDVGPEKGETDYAPIADNKLYGNVPLPWVTRSNIPEDSRNHGTSLFPYFPRYIDFSLPYRPPEHFEDPYAILLNRSPRKEVPIGPDHQAEIPQWDMNASEKGFSGSNISLDHKTREKMGYRIVKMPKPNSSGYASVKIGKGRTDCSCPDVGSTRCVGQHIKETRERLRLRIGDEIFLELGFWEMGEIVAADNWCPDEEQIFYQTVCSNPKSRGRNFWKELSVAIPYTRRIELVSYYFNVFMVRRRAAQNRSYLLEIDSDDDEVWGHEDGSKGIHEYLGSIDGSGSGSECGNVAMDGVKGPKYGQLGT